MSSSILDTGTARHCRTAASQTASGMAIEPVCEPMARAPSLLRPPFQITTGFFEAASFRTLKKRRPSLTPSTYIPMTLICGSEAKYSR